MPNRMQRTPRLRVGSRPKVCGAGSLNVRRQQDFRSQTNNRKRKEHG